MRVTIRRRWGYSDRCICCDDCPSTCVIRDAQQWLHRLACPFLDAFLLWFTRFSYATWTLTVPRSMTFVSVPWRHIWPNHDSLRRLTIKAPGVRRGYRPVSIHIRLFCALCMIYQAFACSISFQRPGFASPDPPSRSSYHIHRAVLTRQVTSRI